ncbi:MAG: DUF2817 domain-containing protein [Microthrixaceae bacterium]
MPQDLLPLTYDECRAQFRMAAHAAGVACEAHAISARGPQGQELTIDVASLGPQDASRALIVLSGVHGVEAPLPSRLQCDLLDRSAQLRLPGDLRVVLVHGVNPWGMAWWRRANENNVDLNRNWNRDNIEAPGNPGYEVMHEHLCPSTPTVPGLDTFVGPMRKLRAEHGPTWMRDVASFGQFTHPDGFYFGGDRTEHSTRLLADIVATQAGAATESLSVDLHTGHGPLGTFSLLTGSNVGSPNHRWICERFDAQQTSGRAAGTPERHRGHLGAGLADVLPTSDHHWVVAEFGTRTDERRVVLNRLENWVHHHGDRESSEGIDIIATNRRYYSPDDPAWARTALEHGRGVLADALTAMHR